MGERGSDDRTSGMGLCSILAKLDNNNNNNNNNNVEIMYVLR
jgi:hypothetical protein